ncbi:ABC transporter ATP-binding protein [Mesoaciditoga lauensis]|uniref:ABC transporter ATP-binding protein n=1 Tax=Mesoaciditoga lauensis TaxID=1495039 RepID=UPI00055FF77C|nr:ABC transporter ATP-binding protein [Mesoaciditoga lauensis]
MRGDLLDVKDLKVVFYTYRGIIKALNGVNVWMNHGERLGIIGETGCGKSVTSLSIMNLIEQPGEIISGDVFFEGKSMQKMSNEEINKIRGRKMSMIFQEPISALNPVMKVGYQVAESVSITKGIPIKDAYDDVFKVLEMVGLDARRTMSLYPHELSGGMAQRVMIAMALVVHPKLLIADEPTSALDVTIQAQIMKLLDELVSEMGNAVILITHDMGVAAEFCDKVAVMYAGNVVEYGDVFKIFDHPLHPYTKGLLKAVPQVGRSEELVGISGSVPDLVNPPKGCRFHPRCSKAMKVCEKALPPLVEIEPGHYVACHLYSQEGEKDEK